MKSMTGFGKGRATSERGTVTVELRSVNSRFLELELRLPSELAAEESTIRGEMQKALRRGKVVVRVSVAAAPGVGEEVQLDEALLSRLEAICRARGQEPSVVALLALPGVVKVRPSEELQEEWRTLLVAALREAIAMLVSERSREGRVLADAMKGMQQQMAEHCDAIEETRGSVVEKYRERLIVRIEELLGPRGVTLDQGRLEQEVALFADKADISEETLRLRTHLTHLLQLLGSDGDSAGKQLEFLNQEILREINTTGSKCRDLDISRRVLELKALAENLREQIANIE